MKKIIFLTISSIFIIFCFIACSNANNLSNDNDSINESPIISFNIENAKALIVYPENNSNRSARSSIDTASGRFMKINQNGDIEAIKARREDGTYDNSIIPSTIIDVSEQFIIIGFSTNVLLVNKTNGNVYDLSSIGLPSGNSYNGTKKNVYTDRNGCIYYLVGGIVKKIDITNENSVTAANYTPDTDSISSFVVSLDGDVLYTTQDNVRIRKRNGGLYNIILNDYYNRYSFVGTDGKIYHVYEIAGNPRASRIDIDENYNVTLTQVKDLSNHGHIYEDGQIEWIYFTDRILAISPMPWEVEDPTHNIRSLSHMRSGALANAKIVKGGGNYWFVASRDGLIRKINPNNDEYETYLSANEYDFYKMEVTSNDEVYFNALRMNDAKKVFGKIDSSGNIEILDDNLTAEIVILKKLN